MRVLTLFLLLLLTGCSSLTQVLRIQPPAELLEDTPHPPRPGVTYRDYLLWLSAYMEALDKANADKAGLRLFYGVVNDDGDSKE